MKYTSSQIFESSDTAYGQTLYEYFKAKKKKKETE